MNSYIAYLLRVASDVSLPLPLREGSAPDAAVKLHPNTAQDSSPAQDSSSPQGTNALHSTISTTDAQTQPDVVIERRPLTVVELKNSEGFEMAEQLITAEQPEASEQPKAVEENEQAGPLSGHDTGHSNTTHSNVDRHDEEHQWGVNRPQVENRLRAAKKYGLRDEDSGKVAVDDGGDCIAGYIPDILYFIVDKGQSVYYDLMTTPQPPGVMNAKRLTEGFPAGDLSVGDVSTQDYSTEGHPGEGADEGLHAANKIKGSVSQLGDGILETYLLGVLMATLLRQRGFLVLHACCVAKDGKAVAFVGESGWGKSTLSEYFCQHGYTLLSDDVLAIRVGAAHSDENHFDAGSPNTAAPDAEGRSDRDERPVAIPGYPQIRLRAEAGRLLRTDFDELPLVNEGNSKRYTVPDAFPNRPFPLHKVYLLEPGYGEKNTLEPMDKRTALLRLSLHARATNLIHAPSYRAQLLRQCEKLVHHVPVDRLRRVRDLNRLHEIKALVDRDIGLSAQGSTSPATCSPDTSSRSASIAS